MESKRKWGTTDVSHPKNRQGWWLAIRETQRKWPKTNPESDTLRDYTAQVIKHRRQMASGYSYGVSFLPDLITKN